MLVFKSIRNDQTVTLTNHAEYFSSVVIAETGEELIQGDQTGKLGYVFPQKGEHRVAVQFKEGITDLSECFWECHQLVYIPNELFNTCTEVKDLSYCFVETNIRKIPEGLFDTCTKLQKLERCFFCTDIKEIPEGLFKYCTKIEDLSWCFKACRKLESIPKGLLDSCTNVKNLNNCFGVTAIKEIPLELFKFCTQVEDLSGCFYGCRKLGSIPKGLLDTCTEVKNLHACFSNTGIKRIPKKLFKYCTKIENLCSGFANTHPKKIPKELFKSCNKIEDLSGCFGVCKKLESIPEGLFDTCTEIKDLSDCFEHTDIREIPERLFKFCNKIENLHRCFWGCRKLESIPKGLFDICSEIKDFSYCFAYTSIKEIPEELLKSCHKIENLGGCFEECKLQKIPKEFINVPLYELENDITLIKSINNEAADKEVKETNVIFSKLSALDEVIGGWKKSEVIIIGGPSEWTRTTFYNIIRNIISSYKIPLTIFSMTYCWYIESIHRCCGKTQNGLLLLPSQKTDEIELYIHNQYIGIPELVLKCRELKQKYHIQAVFIDRLDSTSTFFCENLSDNKKKEIIKQLKMLAKELNIVILTTLDFSRNIQTPTPFELPKFLQAADVILYQSSSGCDEGMANIIIAKNRKGPTGEISLRFNDY